jgi:hypothetical protein
VVKIVNTNETGQGLEIAATGQFVEFGEEVEIDNAALADKLIASGLWAKTTTKAAKAAKEEGN